MAPQNQAASDNVMEYVTVMCGGQMFGLPIARVQDVFKPERLTRVPLAPPEVAGLINLRGRVVTAIEVKSGRKREALSGLAAFSDAFNPARTLLVGGDGIAVEEFLLEPVSHWVAR